MSPNLKRVLGLTDAASLVVGCIIGAGIFRVAAPVAAQLPTPGLIVAVWIVGGLLSFCGALCYAELGAAYPQAGGDYAYLTRAYGRLTGFLFGWTKVFIERTGTIAILGFVCAEYLSQIAGYGAWGVKVVATAAIVGLTVANVAGVQHGSRIQKVMTGLKVAALVAIVVAGWWARDGSFVRDGSGMGCAEPSLSTFSAMGMALIFVLWTYGGWTEAAYIAEEIREPARTLPWAILLGLALTTALYLAVNLVYLAAIPVPELARQPLVAAEVMRRAVGPWGGTVTAGMVAVSTFGALNGYILTSGRILMAMGRDHSIFRRLSTVHPRYATPATALAVNAGLAVLLVWTGTLDQIMTYSTVAISIFFGLAALAVVILRRREPDTPRPYRMWGYPVVPVIFALAMAGFVVNAAVRQPREAAIGASLLALGWLLSCHTKVIMSGSNKVKMSSWREPGGHHEPRRYRDEPGGASAASRS